MSICRDLSRRYEKLPHWSGSRDSPVGFAVGEPMEEGRKDSREKLSADLQRKDGL